MNRDTTSLRPRILVLSDIYPTAAAPQGGSFVAERVEALRAHGAVVDVFALRMVPTCGLRSLLRWTGRDSGPAYSDRFGEAPYWLRPHEYLLNLRRAPRDWLIRRVADAVGRVVMDMDYDVIHAHGMYRAKAGFIAQELARRSGVPYVVTLHGTDVNVNMRRDPEAFVRVFDGAAAAIFVSNALRRTAIALGASEANSHVIPNGVDTDLFRPAAKSRDKPVISFVGNLAPVKGADRLPDIFRGVAKDVPEATFEIAGTGELAASLRERLESFPAVFHGHLDRSQVAALMARSSVLVVPSRSEGWGCVVLEAQASGARVVASRVGGLVESVGDERYLSPVSEGDEGLVSRIVWALGEDESGLRERAMGYSWKSLATREIAIYAAAIRG